MTSPATRPGVVSRLAELRSRRSDAAEICLAVRDLVVVCSSSRGGSSLFGELLRRSGDLLGFSAEINPHFVVPTLGRATGCDAIADPSGYARTGSGLDELRAELGADLGRPAQVADSGDLAHHTAWRLTMQWPTAAIDPDQVAHWTAAALQATAPEDFSREAFALRVLTQARAEHPQINPYRYDLAAPTVAAAFPDASPPVGPPPEPIVEMAPFVLPRAWARASRTAAASATVVATTPRNAFRLPLLAEVFPNARLRVVHLTRNPAAAVNGLRDGWRHHGFFSCRVDEPLGIDGYTDRCGPWATSWWNYDVPPDWRDWTARPLTDVCGHQWRCAHEATMRDAAALGLEVYRLHAEEITGGADRRWRALTDLCGWLGVDPRPVAGNDDLPVVMPTAPPRPRRWADNAEDLKPLLHDPQILDLAAELGYSREPAAWE